MVKCNIFKCQYGCCTLPIRFAVAILAFFAIIVCYGHRNVLNVAITEMVVSNKNTSNHACPQNAKTATLKKVTGGKKNWNEDVQSWLLAMFFPGYVISHMPGGFICDRWGPRWPLLIGLGVSTLLTFLTPWLVVNTDWRVVAATRCIVGFGQGILYPAVTSCLQRWIPPSERSTVGGIVFAANSWGLVIANTATGFIVGLFENWTLAFYFWGLLAVIWLGFAFMYLYSFPETHPLILPDEKQLLEEAIVKKSQKPLPIGKVLSSCPVWALVAGQTSHSIIIFLMATNFPKYMNNVLNYNIKENGALSSIPFVMMWIGSVLAGLLSDWMLLKKNMKISLVRKSIALFASVFPFVFLMAATYSNCHRMLAVLFFSLAMFTKGPTFSSLKVNGMDLTTSHAGFLMAFSNGVGSIAGFLTPKIIGWIAKENTLEQWHYLMWGFNAAQLFLTILFCIFGSGERVKWDYEPEEYEALPPKPEIKWYQQLPPEEFAEKVRLRKEAAAKRKEDAAKRKEDAAKRKEETAAA